MPDDICAAYPLDELAHLSAQHAAQRLLGSYLVRQLPEGTIIAEIVETESYEQDDPASHTYRGRSPRTEAAFGPAGHAYVYQIHGVHYCLDIVVGADGYGSTVLVRAVAPIEGACIMQANRPHASGLTSLTNGPAKLTQAMRIDKSLYGHDLSTAPLQCILRQPIPSQFIVTTTRIGLSKNSAALQRYYDKRSPFVSSR